MKDFCETIRARLHPNWDGIEFEAMGAENKTTGVLAVTQPPAGHSVTTRERDLIGAATLAIVAGYFLPQKIEIEWQSAAAAAPEYPALLQILYDVRAYCGKSSFRSPNLHIRKGDLPVNTSQAAPSATHDAACAGADNLILFSGGIDSTAALVKLLEERQQTVALFLGANFDTQGLEWTAARNIAKLLGVELLRWNWHAQGLPVRGADPVSWPQFGQFPYYNSIPHGRDILSAVLAASIARGKNIQHIAFGQEKESREKKIRYKGRTIYRHDVESREGAKLLQAWLNRSLGNVPTIFSPIEDMTIAEIRGHMIRNHPDLLSQTQSCFWERHCGQCVKCISLYLVQRQVGRNPVRFSANPLADKNNQDLADIILSPLPDNEVGYGAQIRSAICHLIRNNSYTGEDYWIIQAMEQNRFVAVNYSA